MKRDSHENVIVKMVNITKRFGSVIANDHVNFDLKTGEIHALLGENGAGKTTLMNILYGHYRPDEGEIYVNGHKVVIKSPRDAIKLGIFMVHQHPLLVETLSVAENIAIGTELGKRKIIFPVNEVKEKIVEFSKKYGFKVNPDAKIWQLTASERQYVEILKALMQNARVLILDEPTSILAPSEKDFLFNFIKKMRNEGCSIVFITHKLEEAISISDRITVLRKGKVVDTVKPSETSINELARMMVGYDVFLADVGQKDITVDAKVNATVVLEVEDLWVLGDKGEDAVRGVSFKIRAGEIFGVIGVAGNGQSELVEAITGLRKVKKGKIKIFGKDVTSAHPSEIIRLGVAHIPEHRLRYGVVENLSVAENLLLKKYNDYMFSGNIFLKMDKIYEWSKNLISKYSIITPSEKTPVSNLSGGNVQRVIVARELSMQPRLIIAAYPTHGLDIAATKYIRSLLLEHKKKGTAVFLVSSDLDEVFEICDRIAVMYEGKFLAVIPKNKADKEKIGLLMGGVLLHEATV
ncbi:MAG: ABC transporter ATP-binding protein [Candidatus Baldrarchaeia archaeon]